MSLMPRDYRLFYHTSKLDHLLSALKDGFWPRYCTEDYSALFRSHLGEQFWLAAPVVCFTDMPPDANEAHRERYRDYTVAIAKDCAENFGIHPLIYVLAHSPVAEQIVSYVRPGKTGRLKLDAGNPFRPLLPYIKVTPGAQRSRGRGGRPANWEVIPFEDEMEWRYVAIGPGLDLLPDYRDTAAIPDEFQQLSNTHRLKVGDDDITDIIVPGKADAEVVTARFPDLKDKVTLREKS